MNCVNETIAMMYAEGALDAAEAQAAEAHLGACRACAEMVASLRGENTALSAVLQNRLPDARAVVLARLAASMAASVSLGAPAQWALARISEAAAWTDLTAGLPFEIAFRAVRALAPLLMLVAVIQTAHGMTRRTSQGTLIVPAQETVSESLLATGQTVLIEGKVEGNLLAAGESVDVRGEVTGDVLAAGRQVRISGRVHGNVFAAAESVLVTGQVAGSLYAGGRIITLEKGGRIEREMIAGGATITADGSVGYGLVAGGTSASIAGAIARGVDFAGTRVLVRSSGKVSGVIRARVPARNNVQVEQGASVGGVVVTQPAPTVSRWARPGTYVWEAAVLAGAFLVGWLLMAWFPGFFAGTVRAVPTLPGAGIGFVLLFSVPIAAVLLGITLVLIPVSVGALFLWLAGLYLSKVLVAAYLGKSLLGARGGSELPTLAGLLAGLVILQAAFLIPYGGGILKFAVFCLGLGALFLELRHRVQSRPAAS
jgi:cytoskeletal protein CcmA (bactofilin family)